MLFIRTEEKRSNTFSYTQRAECSGGGLVTKSGPTLATPWTVSHQALLSMGFSRQEYWWGVAISFSRGSSRPRNRTQVSCTAGKFFTNWTVREAQGQKDQEAYLVAQLVKNPPTMLETWVPSLAWEDTLEKGTATHSSILAQPILLIMMLRNQ